MPSYASLASIEELESEPFREFTTELSIFADSIGLPASIPASKHWEYPWIWKQICHYPQGNLLDIGSGLSPWPWFLSKRCPVTMVEIDPDLFPIWQKTGARAKWRIVSDELLPFEKESFDFVTSLSVIEHQPNKQKAISEIIRVLRPGGILAISFDVAVEGGVYPAENGQPLKTKSFEDLIWFLSAFGNLNPPEWNFEDIPPFLEWHKTTEPHHTYTVGAAVLQKL